MIAGPERATLAIGRRRQSCAPAPIPATRFSDRAAAAPVARRERTCHQPFDQVPRRGLVTAVDIDRADHRLAHVGEDGGAAARASIVFRGHRRRRRRDRSRSAQVSLRTRSASRRDSSPSSALGKARYNMSDITRPRTWLPLEPRARLRAPLERQMWGQRAFQASRHRQRIADAIFESGRGALAAPRLFGLRLRRRPSGRDRDRRFANFVGLAFLRPLIVPA